MNETPQDASRDGDDFVVSRLKSVIMEGKKSITSQPKQLFHAGRPSKFQFSIPSNIADGLFSKRTWIRAVTGIAYQVDCVNIRHDPPCNIVVELFWPLLSRRAF